MQGGHPRAVAHPHNHSPAHAAELKHSPPTPHAARRVLSSTRLNVPRASDTRAGPACRAGPAHSYQCHRATAAQKNSRGVLPGPGVDFGWCAASRCRRRERIREHGAEQEGREEVEGRAQARSEGGCEAEGDSASCAQPEPDGVPLLPQVPLPGRGKVAQRRLRPCAVLRPLNLKWRLRAKHLCRDTPYARRTQAKHAVRKAPVAVCLLVRFGFVCTRDGYCVDFGTRFLSGLVN